MAQKTITIPDGFVDLTLLLPTSRLQDIIDTYATQGGYNPAVHGTDKAKFAKAVLGASIDRDTVAHVTSVQVSTQAASDKIVVL